jgi:fumarate reductase (CoM/CoB) subunit A
MIEKCDVLVIGGGAAAVRAAIEAAQPGVEVLLVDKGEFGRSGTSPLGLHGFASVQHATDSEAILTKDILHSGSNLNDFDLIRRAVTETRQEPKRLEAFGVRFVQKPDGSYDIYRGAGHSVPHGLTFDDEGNGINFVAVLGREAWKRGVRLVEHVMITGLLADGGHAVGAYGINEGGEDCVFSARAVVLAAGGANRMFPNIVPRIANTMYRTTGDGYALAARAGLPLVDMEMANFRDTPPAARLAGKYVNAKGEHFMGRYDPMGENAPRGKVVEALYREIQAGNAPIHIELTPESERIAKFMPAEYKDYVRAYKEGHPPAVEIVFQRLLGGARINDDATTAIDGLCVAGEAEGGFHGGDRLQGAAFLETQVFGRMAGLSATAYAGAHVVGNSVDQLARAASVRVHRFLNNQNGARAGDIIKKVQQIAWDHASIVKDKAGLDAALDEIRALRAEIAKGLAGAYTFEPLEADNLALTAEAVILASMKRDESRGNHLRSDFPAPKNALARVHTSISMNGNGELAASFVPCRN